MCSSILSTCTCTCVRSDGSSYSYDGGSYDRWLDCRECCPDPCQTCVLVNKDHRTQEREAKCPQGGAGSCHTDWNIFTYGCEKIPGCTTTPPPPPPRNCNNGGSSDGR
jgi:hypothetical protein